MNELLEYIQSLKIGSFKGWSEDEKKGYLTACVSIENKARELMIPPPVMFEFAWMYGDGDHHHTMMIDPRTYDVNIEVIEEIYRKSENYEVDTILSQNNSEKEDRLTDEELETFKRIYEDLPEFGNFKENSYVFVG